MKENWSQKVNKIVAEALQLSLKIAVFDGVTNGQLSDTLTNTPNYKDYFVGGITTNDYKTSQTLFSIRLSDLSADSKRLQQHLKVASDYAANWFSGVNYRILLIELPTVENDIRSIMICLSGVTPTVVQPFIFNMNEKTTEDFRNTIVNYTLDMIIENLLRIPHLKLLNYE